MAGQRHALTSKHKMRERTRLHLEHVEQQHCYFHNSRALKRDPPPLHTNHNAR